MIELKEGEILVLRTSGADGKSYNDFQWPRSGAVEAPDWDGKAECGGGLHGLPRGCGNGDYLDWSEAATAQLVRVDTRADYLEFKGKCKFRGGEVVYFGTLREAIEILCQHYPDAPTVGRTASAGDHGTASAGYRGTASAGYRGTASAGDRGTASAGYRGTANAGDEGTASAGDGGTASAGDEGTLVIKYWDGDRYRLAVGYVGEDGIKPNTPYRVENGRLVEVKAGG